ncbi:hypothetical protein JJB98_01630 [Bradyrhizobium diazoefficiens]|nr:hypothetical protein [Bradyrhizobium diazoefficiens]QQO18706.1 hypothetical protein JJB98_01630 [Bradyrhizobium diazoefficiens]
MAFNTRCKAAVQGIGDGEIGKHEGAFNHEVQIRKSGLRPVCLLSGPLRGLLNPSGRE